MVASSGEVDRDKMCEIRVKLGDFETMTWNEIKRTAIKGKKPHHYIAIQKLCVKAQRRLRDIKRDDLPGVFSLRLRGKERVVVILVEGVAELLWWDPRHEVCPSKKKHT